MINEKNNLCMEDCDTLRKSSDAGPCHEIAVLANGVLNRLVSEIIRRVNSDCRSIADKRDYSDCGYEFRNVFECVSWICRKWGQHDLFDPEDDIKSTVEEISCEVLHNDTDITGKKLLLAWYWECIDKEIRVHWGAASAMSERALTEALTAFIVDCVEDQMQSTAKFVDKQIDVERAEYERRWHEEYEYSDDDGYIEFALDEILKMRPDNEILKRASEYAHKFFAKQIEAADEALSFSIVYRNNGESKYLGFSLDEDRMAISEGGYVVSDAGGDSYGDEVWSIEAYDHAHGCVDAVSIAEDLLGCGGEIEED